jgi:triacylglycerol lipase
MADRDPPDETSARRGQGLAGALQRSGWFARWLAGAPARWLGKESGVGQNLIGGTADGLSYLRHLARGNRVVRQSFPAAPAPTADAAPTTAPAPTAEAARVDPPTPVLLIHGFLGTRGSMYLLERRLIDDGFVVVSFNIGALNSRDIRRSAFMIHRKIERVLAHSPAQKIDIIGHSMGGLIGLYLVKKLGGHARVRRLVMMGTPARGTWVALAGVATLGLWSTSSWQLLPRSRFLDELAQGPIPADTEVFTLAAARDWVVPLTQTRVPGATAVTVPLGHSSLVVAEDVYRRLVAILRSPTAASAAQPDIRSAVGGSATTPDHDDDPEPLGVQSLHHQIQRRA